MNRKSLRGSLLLLLGSVIWGAAFVAQRVGMDHMGPFTFNGIRMLLAWLVMIPVTFLFERKNKKSPAYQAPDPKEQRLSFLSVHFSNRNEENAMAFLRILCRDMLEDKNTETEQKMNP